MKIRYILGLSAFSIAMQSSFAISGMEEGLIAPVRNPIGELHAPNVQGQTVPTPTVTPVPKVQVVPVPKVQVVPVVPVPAVKPVMPEPKTFTTPKVPGAEY